MRGRGFRSEQKEDYGKGNVLGGIGVALRCQDYEESFSHTFP